MKNDFWSIMVFFGDGVQIFHTKEDPSKERRIIERATLVIPPNDVVPLKDRFGLFDKPSLTFLTLAQIWNAIQKTQTVLKGDDL